MCVWERMRENLRKGPAAVNELARQLSRFSSWELKWGMILPKSVSQLISHQNRAFLTEPALGVYATLNTTCSLYTVCLTVNLLFLQHFSHFFSIHMWFRNILYTLKNARRLWFILVWANRSIRPSDQVDQKVSQRTSRTQRRDEANFTASLVHQGANSLYTFVNQVSHLNLVCIMITFFYKCWKFRLLYVYKTSVKGMSFNK